MARPSTQGISSALSWTCRRCRTPNRPPCLTVARLWAPTALAQRFSTSPAAPTDRTVIAAPEIDFDESTATPARIIPASPSYFTASPVFNDHLLELQSLVKTYRSLPTSTPHQTQRALWLNLGQYRSSIGEKIAASKYAKAVHLLARLNKIHPRLRPKEVDVVLDRFRRPGSEKVQLPKQGRIDEFGRSCGVGRRKESTAKVYLVEGTGEVLVNGRGLAHVFPRPHDRESALWALKITERMDKYNVFALVSGGGVTGQAEAVTLGVTKALLVHEPALKPALRRAGCVTSDPRHVERKKPGRLKARKRPAWVKR